MVDYRSWKRVAASLAIGSLCACTSACTAQPTETLALHSPSDRYRVILRGGFAAPRSFLVNHEVTATVARAGEAPFVQLPLHIGDNFDEGFRQTYPGQEWITENVLRFRGDHPRARDGGELVVENLSDSPVHGIRVALMDDLILLFDLPPKSVSSVPIAAGRPGESPSLVLYGRRDSTTSIPYTFQRFQDGDGQKRWRGKVVVTVTTDGAIRVAAISKG